MGFLPDHVNDEPSPVVPARGDSTLMRDTVRYALPLWPLGELAMPLVRRDLAQIFDFRRDNVASLLDQG